MAVVELSSKKEFDHTIRNGLSIIDFNAHWCGPCRDQEPIFDALDEAFNGKVTVAKVSIDDHQLIAMDLNIQSIPTIILFNQGRELQRLVGFQDGEALSDALQAALDCGCGAGSRKQ
jgi:thioredoxin 1